MGHNNLPLLNSWTTVVSWDTETNLKTKGKQTNKEKKQPQDMLLNLYKFTFNEALRKFILGSFKFCHVQ